MKYKSLQDSSAVFALRYLLHTIIPSQKSTPQFIGLIRSMRHVLFCLSLFFALPLTSAPCSNATGHAIDQPYHSSTQTLQLEQRFAFDPYPDSHAQTVNSILQQIAEGSGKLRAFTSYRFQINIDISISEVSKNKHHLVLETANAMVTGDVLYRDFSLERVLIPDKANLRVVLSTAAGVNFLEKAFVSVDIPADPGVLLDLFFDHDVHIDDIQVAITDVFFYYDTRMYDRFMVWAEALESYYAMGDQLQNIDELIDGLNTADPRKLLLDEFGLCEAEVMMGEIQHASFHEWIDIRKNDPAGFFPRYRSLQQEIDMLRADFNHAIAHIDSLFYHQGMLIAGDTCLSAGREFFLLAVDYNPFHIVSHLALTRIDIQKDRMMDALERMGVVFKLMHPHADDRKKSVWLADSLLNLFFDASMEFIVARRYTESLDLLGHVRAFCTQVHGNYLCPPMLAIMLRQTHRGMYESFLVVSRRAIRDDNLRLAATYLESAISYQDANSQFIHDHHNALDLLFRVLTRHRVLYELNTITGFGDVAVQYKNQAIGMIEQYPVIHAHLIDHANNDDLATAVLNFATLSYAEKSISFLHKLKAKGADAADLIYQQRVSGAAAAGYFKAMDNSMLPGSLFTILDVHDPWFREFRFSFINAW